MPSLVEPAIYRRLSALCRVILCGVISRIELDDRDAQSMILVVNV